jgi:hypothetical protein
MSSLGSTFIIRDVTRNKLIDLINGNLILLVFYAQSVHMHEDGNRLKYCAVKFHKS